METQMRIEREPHESCQLTLPIAAGVLPQLMDLSDASAANPRAVDGIDAHLP